MILSEHEAESVHECLVSQHKAAFYSQQQVVIFWIKYELGDYGNIIYDNVRARKNCITLLPFVCVFFPHRNPAATTTSLALPPVSLKCVITKLILIQMTMNGMCVSL